MVIKAQLPDGTMLEFPEGTEDAVIDATVKSHLTQPEIQPMDFSGAIPSTSAVSTAQTELVPSVEDAMKPRVETDLSQSMLGGLADTASFAFSEGPQLLDLGARLGMAKLADYADFSPSLKSYLQEASQEPSKMAEIAEKLSWRRSLENMGVLEPEKPITEKTAEEVFAEGVGGAVLKAPSVVVEKGLKKAVIPMTSKLIGEGASGVAFHALLDTFVEQGMSESRAFVAALGTMILGPTAAKGVIYGGGKAANILPFAVSAKEKLAAINPKKYTTKRGMAGTLIQKSLPSDVDLTAARNRYEALVAQGMDPRLVDVLPEEHLMALHHQLQSHNPTFAALSHEKNRQNLSLILDMFEEVGPKSDLSSVAVQGRLTTAQQGQRDKLLKQIEETQESLANEIRPTYTADDLEKGRTVRDAADTLAEKLQASVDEEWRNLRKDARGVSVDFKPIIDKVQKDIKDLPAFKQAIMSSPFVSSAIKNLVDKNARVTMEDIIDANLEVSNAYRLAKKQGGRDAVYLGILKSAIDDYMDDFTSITNTPFSQELANTRAFTRQQYHYFKDGAIGKLRQFSNFDPSVPDAGVTGMFLGNSPRNVQNASQLNKAFGKNSPNYDPDVWQAIAEKAMEDLWYKSRKKEKFKVGGKTQDKLVDFVSPKDYKDWMRENERTFEQMPELRERFSTYDKTMQHYESRFQQSYASLEEFDKSSLGKYVEDENFDRAIQLNYGNTNWWLAKLDAAKQAGDDAAVRGLRAVYWKETTRHVTEKDLLKAGPASVVDPYKVLSSFENDQIAARHEAVLGKGHYGVLKELAKLTSEVSPEAVSEKAREFAKSGQSINKFPLSVPQLTTLHRDAEAGRISHAYVSTFVGTRLLTYAAKHEAGRLLQDALMDPKVAFDLLQFEKGKMSVPEFKAMLTSTLKKPPYFAIPPANILLQDEEEDFEKTVTQEFKDIPAPTSATFNNPSMEMFGEGMGATLPAPKVDEYGSVTEFPEIYDAEGNFLPEPTFKSDGSTSPQSLDEPMGLAPQEDIQLTVDISGASEPVKKAIFDASASVGVDPNLMFAIAGAESSFDPNVKAPKGTATGLFQFIEDTWESVVKKYGEKHGISIEDIRDPRANAIMGGELIRENVASFNRSFGRDPSPKEIYLYHFSGPTVARKVIKALKSNPNKPAVEIWGEKAANNNRSIFYKNGKPRTVKEVYDKLTQKVASVEDGVMVTDAS